MKLRLLLIALILVVLSQSAYGVEPSGIIGSTTTYGYAQDLYVSGNYAYVVNSTPALFTVVDVSDPTAPFVTDTLHLEHLDPYVTSQTVYLSGGFAYVGTGSAGSGGEIFKIDVSDPYNIFFAWPFIGLRPCNCNVEEIRLYEDYLFAVTDMAGLCVFDNSNPDTLIYIDCVPTPGYGKGLSISGDYAYVGCNGGGLAIYDISDPENIPPYCARVDTG